MNDAQSTIVGLKAQDCPGGDATVADCLKHGTCGCIYGDAVQHIEANQRLRHLLRAYIDQGDTMRELAENELERSR